MLQGIRDRAKGWFAWVIVIFISIPFALWGIQEYFGTDPNVAVAEVNGTELGLQQFQLAYQRQRQQLRNLLGAQADPGLLDDERLKRETLDALIDSEIMVQTGIQDGLYITDEQLAAVIQSQEAFQRDGSFSQSAYEEWLRSQGYSAGYFESQFRRSRLSQQVLAAINGSAIVGEQDLEHLTRLLRERRTFAELRVPWERYQTEDVSQDQVNAYYEQNASRFVTEEQVNVAYVELSLELLAESVVAEEEDLQRLYEAEKANYVVPEQRRASHVLVAVAADADEETERDALARVKSLRDQIESGSDFAAIAKEHSDDPGSREQGGDLGFFARGVMDPAFEEAAFSLEVGAVSQPIRSSFGFHLIKVAAVRPAEGKSFAAVRSELLAEYRRREAEQLFFAQAEQLANLAFEHPDSLDPAAETLGLQVRETGFFGREGNSEHDIAGERKVIEAAFSADVLAGGNNSELIELSSDRAVVVRVKEHRPEKQQSLVDVAEVIQETLQAEQARKEAEALGRKILVRLRSGEEPTAVGSDYGLEWESARTVNREAEDVKRELLTAVFRIPRPKADVPTYDGIISGSGDFVVLSLQSVETDDTGESDSELRESVDAALRQDYGRAEFEAYLSSLRDVADLRIFEERI